MKISTSAALSILAIATACSAWSTPQTPAFKSRGTTAAQRTSSTAILSAAVEESAAATYADPTRYLSDHPDNNVPPHIAALVGKGLHTKPDHPIGIIRSKIQEYFAMV